MKRLALFLTVPLLAACSVFGAPALPTLAPESLITPSPATNTPSPATNTPMVTPSHVLATPTLTPTNTLIPTDVRATETNTPTVPTNTPYVALSDNVTELPYQSCSWQWASQMMPELGIQIADEMMAAGLSDVTVTAVADGENCMDRNTNTVNHFAAMNTSLEIKVQVADVRDQKQTTQDLLTVLTVLKNYPPGVTPGPMPGTVTIKIITEPQQALFSKPYNEMMLGLAAYSAGEDLLSDMGVAYISTLP